MEYEQVLQRQSLPPKDGPPYPAKAPRSDRCVAA